MTDDADADESPPADADELPEDAPDVEFHPDDTFDGEGASDESSDDEPVSDAASADSDTGDDSDTDLLDDIRSTVERPPDADETPTADQSTPTDPTSSDPPTDLSTADGPPIADDSSTDDRGSTAERQPAEGGDQTETSAPLADLVSEMRSADERAADDETDWDRLAEEAFAEPEPETTADAAEPVTETDAPEHVVDKREYCQRCEYLQDPPELACQNEGTEIVEVVDGERFRVRACPMIGENGPTFENGSDD